VPMRPEQPLPASSLCPRQRLCGVGHGRVWAVLGLPGGHVVVDERRGGQQPVPCNAGSQLAAVHSCAGGGGLAAEVRARAAGLGLCPKGCSPPSCGILLRGWLGSFCVFDPPYVYILMMPAPHSLTPGAPELRALVRATSRPPRLVKNEGARAQPHFLVACVRRPMQG